VFSEALQLFGQIDLTGNVRGVDFHFRTHRAFNADALVQPETEFDFIVGHFSAELFVLALVHDGRIVVDVLDSL